MSRIFKFVPIALIGFAALPCSAQLSEPACFISVYIGSTTAIAQGTAEIPVSVLVMSEPKANNVACTFRGLSIPFNMTVLAVPGNIPLGSVPLVWNPNDGQQPVRGGASMRASGRLATGQLPPGTYNLSSPSFVGAAVFGQTLAVVPPGTPVPPPGTPIVPPAPPPAPVLAPVIDLILQGTVGP